MECRLDSISSPDSFLLVNANCNLLAAWYCRASWIEPDHNDPRTICNITVSKQFTYFTVYKSGLILDTAALALGLETLCLDENLTVTSVSDEGETFLDAIAKKIHLGSNLDSDMLCLIGALLSETAVQLVHRKKAPQVAMRSLCTETLHQDYDVEAIVLGGQVAKLVFQRESVTSDPTTMPESFADGIFAALEEREYAVRLDKRSCDQLLSTKFEALPIHLESSDILPPCTDVPIIDLLPFPVSNDAERAFALNRIDERLRRYGIRRPMPLLFLADPTVAWLLTDVIGQREIIYFCKDREDAEEIQSKIVENPFASVCIYDGSLQDGDMLTIRSDEEGEEIVSLKRIVFGKNVDLKSML